MKALKLAHPASLDSLALVDIPDPGQPGPGEIRVRIAASSLDAHDLSVVLGQMRLTTDRIPMSDGAGTVEAVGAGVTEFKPGDAVVSCFFPHWQDGAPMVGDFKQTPGDGLDGYAREVVVTPATWFTLAPKGYSHREAATLTTAGLTAWRALVVDAGIKPGDTILALGSGGVSIFALQLGKAMGAEVIITSSSDEKLEKAKALGADHLINYRRTENWSAEVLARTNGRGADLVIEVGGSGTLPHSISAARIGGHIALIGVLAGVAGDIPTWKLMRRQQKLQGLIVGSRRHQRDFVRALDGLPLRPVIDRGFAFADAADAFRYEMGGHHFGKICLEWEV